MEIRTGWSSEITLIVSAIKSPYGSKLREMDLSKTTWLGIFFLIAGFISGKIEEIYYGNRLDENNVLQESFFLPLAIILTFLGIAFLTVAVVRYSVRKLRGIA